VEKAHNAHKVSVKPVTVVHKWNQKIDTMVFVDCHANFNSVQYSRQKRF